MDALGVPCQSSSDNLAIDFNNILIQVYHPVCLGGFWHGTTGEEATIDSGSTLSHCGSRMDIGVDNLNRWDDGTWFTAMNELHWACGWASYCSAQSNNLCAWMLHTSWSMFYYVCHINHQSCTSTADRKSVASKFRNDMTRPNFQQSVTSHKIHDSPYQMAIGAPSFPIGSAEYSTHYTMTAGTRKRTVPPRPSTSNAPVPKKHVSFENHHRGRLPLSAKICSTTPGEP